MPVEVGVFKFSSLTDAETNFFAVLIVAIGILLGWYFGSRESDEVSISYVPQKPYNPASESNQVVVTQESVVITETKTELTSSSATHEDVDDETAENGENSAAKRGMLLQHYICLEI